MCSLVWLETVQFGFDAWAQFEEHKCENLQQTKEEDFASLSVAGLAHISGPAVAENYWVTLKDRTEKALCCFVTSTKLMYLNGHNGANNHQGPTRRHQHWCFLK